MKRFLSVLLTLITLIAVIVVFGACDEGAHPNSSEGVSTGVGSTEHSELADLAELIKNIPGTYYASSEDKTITLKSNKTFVWGEYEGTWSRDEMTITLIYEVRKNSNPNTNGPVMKRRVKATFDANYLLIDSTLYEKVK